MASSLIVWRDVGSEATPHPCGTRPDWFPLGQSAVYQFDEQENPVEIVSPNPLPFVGFPAATQHASLEGPFDFGVVHLDLNPAPEIRAQSFVGSTVRLGGSFSLDRRATPMDSGCDAGGCTFGQAAAPARVCLKTTVPGATSFEVGDVPRLFVSPGCYSSTCTRIYNSECSLHVTGNQLTTTSKFCMEDISGGGGCSPDCGGGASCQASEGLDAGDYTLKAGNLTIEFSVPMALPPPTYQLCVTANSG